MISCSIFLIWFRKLRSFIKPLIAIVRATIQATKNKINQNQNCSRTTTSKNQSKFLAQFRPSRKWFLTTQLTIWYNQSAIREQNQIIPPLMICFKARFFWLLFSANCFNSISLWFFRLASSMFFFLTHLSILIFVFDSAKLLV